MHDLSNRLVFQVYLNDSRYCFHQSLLFSQLCISLPRSTYISSLQPRRRTLNPLNIHHPHHHQHIFIFNHADWRNVPPVENYIEYQYKGAFSSPCHWGRCQCFYFSRFLIQLNKTLSLQWDSWHRANICSSLMSWLSEKEKNNNKSTQILKQVFKIITDIEILLLWGEY